MIKKALRIILWSLVVALFIIVMATPEDFFTSKEPDIATTCENFCSMSSSDNKRVKFFSEEGVCICENSKLSPP